MNPVLLAQGLAANGYLRNPGNRLVQRQFHRLLSGARRRDCI